jgi:hypothetical protein
MGERAGYHFDRFVSLVRPIHSPMLLVAMTVHAARSVACDASTAGPRYGHFTCQNVGDGIWNLCHREALERLVPLLDPLRRSLGRLVLWRAHRNLSCLARDHRRPLPSPKPRWRPHGLSQRGEPLCDLDRTAVGGLSGSRSLTHPARRRSLPQTGPSSTILPLRPLFWLLPLLRQAACCLPNCRGDLELRGWRRSGPQAGVSGPSARPVRRIYPPQWAFWLCEPRPEPVLPERRPPPPGHFGKILQRHHGS